MIDGDGDGSGRTLRFHWSLSSAGDKYRRALAERSQAGAPPLDDQLALCRRAEECGIESMLMAIGFARPDPLLLSAALGRRTDCIRFMVAVRAGLVSPTYFVQQVNTLSALIGGRVDVNFVCGHTYAELGYYGDFLDHDRRYDRLDEFIAVCGAFWGGGGPVDFRGEFYRVSGGALHTPYADPGRSAPSLYLGGDSEQAAGLAAKHGCCVWRLAREVPALGREIGPLRRAGVRVGVLVSLIARPSREEAVAAAESLLEPLGRSAREAIRERASRYDSRGFRGVYDLAESAEGPWRGHCLWTGAVPFLGPPAVALVGSAEEVARTLVEYKRIGVGEFLFMGWPDLEEMTFFGREVLPLVREMEVGVPTTAPASESPA